MQSTSALSLPESFQPILEKLVLCQRLPSPPTVAEKILALVEDRSATMNDFADVIRLDPGLAARLIRMGNSPIYGQRREILEVRQAITLVGLDATISNALSIALVASMRDEATQSNLDQELFWSRSVAAASAGRLLARHIHLKVPETVFMGALLQDIGMLALDSLGEPGYAGIGPQQRDHRKLIAHEIKVFGIDHAAAGAWLASRWKMPMQYCQAILASHEPMETPVDAENAQLADCVAVAGLVADIFYGPDAQTCVRRALALGEQRVQLSPSVLASLLPKLIEELTEVSGLFEVDLGGPEFFEERHAAALQALEQDAQEARPQAAGASA